jgi:hypothetical protein
MTVLEKRIVENIWRFDPFSLLILLARMGYKMEDILFRSHFSYSSQSRLIETIEFRNSPKKALITLNLGLLGGQSVLPSYLFQQVDNHQVDAEQFEEFFGYFDDRLLRRFLFSIYPELNQSFSCDWDARKTAMLYTLKLDSPTTLHWLLQLVFPDLQIRVKKGLLKRSVVLNAPILGKCRLGYQTVFGKRKQLTVPGSLITLISDEEYFANDQPWAMEINHRLQRIIFPLLENVGVDLEIWLVIRNQGSALSLKKNSYLGYENLLSDKLQVRRIRVFSGYICN